ncbi:hypothetical protein ADK55_28735 [Streptomyces sp. WM4235]|nr:hypothetical protein ADK55_28735 [Streptomyces sp. WM4235]
MIVALGNYVTVHIEAAAELGLDYTAGPAGLSGTRSARIKAVPAQVPELVGAGHAVGVTLPAPREVGAMAEWQTPLRRCEPALNGTSSRRLEQEGPV